MPSETIQEALLSVKRVSKAFDGKQALKDLSFDVYTGEIFGFLGPSGAGKTTTIKLATRQLKADDGEIVLFGQPIWNLPQEVFDKVGVLSDNSGLYERLSVKDNLALYADLKRIPHKAIDDLLAQVGLADEKAKPVKTLSKGMKQRLMLARAVLHKPSLLFLDEPTAALDPGTSLQIHLLLRQLNNEGTTIFLTTHNMEEADRLCHRVAFLNHGSIVACDTPESHKLSHATNSLTARTESGAIKTVQKSAEGLRELTEWLSGEILLTLHSQEPNLEEVFLQLTGRNLS